MMFGEPCPVAATQLTRELLHAVSVEHIAQQVVTQWSGD